MSHKGKKKSKFSPRQIKFLELYFAGCSLKAAARGAGYLGASDSALCNTGRAILLRAVAIDARIAQLLLEASENCLSESGRLKGLTILVKAMSYRR